MTAALPSPRASHTLALADELATAAVARTIAARMEEVGDLRIDLLGELGAGKTTFVRHLLRSLGVQGRIKSPTYALLESYELSDGLPEVAHFDLYRLESPQEWLDSGLQDVLHGPGLRLVEWPQKAGELIGTPDLSLSFAFGSHDPSRRQLSLRAYSAAGHDVLQSVMKSPL
ncbi:hypothetical protein AAV94_06770 [Lampropedia cohaerens]|uniref:tRNA threonylcarbamoyladenosine biosynthesis protein TsaE n=1 Tax=Lampropedia cohaerens TaxID=1610491 RepID=A0A0U1Q080_9BURK|nr:tRNA (adenosine(37)-N6)-threonylcarbamoyltransferase complex ATPase subunit type 1 TsaE [Lampropedia cohaerens]KKW68160.1 hypothetical protein AAV94_06770 [Lampropedia cohaerens]